MRIQKIVWWNVFKKLSINEEGRIKMRRIWNPLNIFAFIHYFDDYQSIYIAYEPSYLIGLDEALPMDKIIDTLSYIKKIVEFIGIKNYKLLYGGAVNSSNIKELLSDRVDGYLLGKSSIDIEELRKIIKCIK